MATAAAAIRLGADCTTPRIAATPGPADGSTPTNSGDCCEPEVRALVEVPTSGIMVKLLKMGSETDPEALVTFEHWTLDTVVVWPMDHWPTLLFSYLTCPA